MHIGIVTPAPARSRKGNRVTALRWARILGDLGHQVSVDQTCRTGRRLDLLVAMHARRSYPSIRLFQRQRPEAPLIVALTGTDLYGDLNRSQRAREALDLASCLLLLQPDGIRYLPRAVRHKVRTIYQSAPAPATTARPLKRIFEVCVVGHLRPVKDPFRAAMAVRKLPADSRISISHIGEALTQHMARHARREMAVNRRYRWLGDLPRHLALKRIQRSRLMVISSKMEGGPNVATEAIAASVPIISSRISGMVGLFGTDYPGYFPVGNSGKLQHLLHRAETDPAYYGLLKQHCRRARPLVAPRRERASWKQLLREMHPAERSSRKAPSPQRR